MQWHSHPVQPRGCPRHPPQPGDPLAGQITELFQARDIYIAVFEDWDAWVAGGEDCADLFARKLAEGTGKIVYTDNDNGVWLFNVAISYWLIYRSIGLKEKIDTLFLASSGAYFANVIAPTAGASGLAVFITTARRNGYSTARATIAGALYILFDYLGFMFILTLGLIVLSAVGI